MSEILNGLKYELTPKFDVILLYSKEHLDKDSSMPYLLQAFRSAGLNTGVKFWTDVDGESSGWKPTDARVIVFRSIWDYVAKITEFRKFLEGLAKYSHILNPISVIQWNIHKSYLQDLGACGVPIIPLLLIPFDARPKPNVMTLVEERVSCDPIWKNMQYLIIKPAISSCGNGLQKFKVNDMTRLENEIQEVMKGQVQDLLIQPFIEEIQGVGETSLFFFEEEYAYAVKKVPKENEFLVQREHGGTYSTYDPTEQELKVGLQTIEGIRSRFQNLTYARIDLVNTSKYGPLVMEAELIEPGLYFDLAPKGSAEKFVRAVSGKIVKD